ncbi:hypothetical protein BJG01_13490 [Vibrio splendidus]|nr:hypothetical protein BJG01_13490 [Vibrio splendidus]URM15994.1 AraC family transcriptional regulator [Vibrio splendidus]
MSSQVSPALYILRANHMKPFLDKFNEIGSPIESQLNKVGLASGMFDDPNDFVFEHAVWRFIGNTAKLEGVQELGFLVTESATLPDYGEFGRLIVSAPNLFQALNIFIDKMSLQSNCLGYWLEECDDYLWICRPGVPSFDVGSWQVEQHVLSFIIQIIQHFLGSNWKPHFVKLQSEETLGYEFYKSLRNVPYTNGCRYTSIPVLKRDLPTQNTNSDIESGFLPSMNPAPLGFVNTLKQLMHQGYFGVEIKQLDVAESVFMNERTLKRRLQACDTNFRSILAEVQYEKAIHLMSFGNHDIADIAIELGFKHPNNFSRAFKAWCGITPSEYVNLKNNSESIIL